MELKCFLAFLLFAGAADIISMRKARLKKEIVPYLVLTALTAAFAIAYLSAPARASLTYSIVKLLGLKGF